MRAPCLRVQTADVNADSGGASHREGRSIRRAPFAAVCGAIPRGSSSTLAAWSLWYLVLQEAKAATEAAPAAAEPVVQAEAAEEALPDLNMPEEDQVGAPALVPSPEPAS
jgi:hypothetical protein